MSLRGTEIRDASPDPDLNKHGGKRKKKQADLILGTEKTLKYSEVQLSRTSVS